MRPFYNLIQIANFLIGPNECKDDYKKNCGNLNIQCDTNIGFFPRLLQRKFWWISVVSILKCRFEMKKILHKDEIIYESQFTNLECITQIFRYATKN
jgi:hypothetical protein